MVYIQPTTYSSVKQAKSESPYRRSLLLITKLFVICATALAMGEVSWRIMGAQPMRSDVLAFAELRRAARNSFSSVALLGSSRVLCDLDPKILKRELPNWEFYQLAIDGTSALPVLENLAHDKEFRGRVLCEFKVSHFFATYPYREFEGTGLWYLHFVERRPYQYFEPWFYGNLGQYSALVAASHKDFAASLIRIGKSRLTGAAGKSSGSEDAMLPPELVRREDRFLGLHRRGKDNSRAIAQWVKMAQYRPPSGKNSGLEHVPSWVQSIRERGGDVVFVRMPVSGSLRYWEDRVYPERDEIVKSLAAKNIDVIDFAKEPALSGFDCPDESHLDADDAERFSAALASILKERRLLTRVSTNDDDQH